MFYLLILRLPILLTRNRLLSARVEDVLKHAVLTAFALGVGWAEYVFFARFWQLLGSLPLGYELVLPRVFSLMGTFLFAFLFYSSILTALSSLYRSDDLPLLLASPVPLPWILLNKWFDIAVRSGGTLVLLSIPPALALAAVLPLGWMFYPGYLLSVLFLASAAVSLGIAAAMTMAAIFPVRRMHQTLMLLGLCITAILIAGIRVLHLETLWSGGAMSNPLILFVQREPSVFWRLAPGHLLANALTPLLSLESHPILGLLQIIAFGGVPTACVVFFGKRLFLAGWWRSREQADAQIHPARWTAPQRRRIGPLYAMIRKDWTVLKRDASIWTQLFMMLPLALLYLLNLYYLPLGSKDLAPLLALANVVLIAMIVSAVGARFLFPAASREGRAVWIPASAPVRASMVISQKFLFASPPIIVLGGIMLTVSVRLLKLPLETEIWSLLYGSILTVQLCGLAVFMGFCFPTYRYKHLLAVSLGKGALFYMLLALVQIGSFAFVVYRALLDSASLPWIDPSLIGWFSTWSAVTLICYIGGKRRWKRAYNLER